MKHNAHLGPIKNTCSQSQATMRQTQEVGRPYDDHDINVMGDSKPRLAYTLQTDTAR